jgi:hypothetical protein
MKLPFVEKEKIWWWCMPIILTTLEVEMEMIVV